MRVSVRTSSVSVILLCEFALASAFTPPSPFHASSSSFVSSVAQSSRAVTSRHIPGLGLARGTSAVALAMADSEYMKKIPPHLRGLAVRKTREETKEYTAAPKSEDDDVAQIQKELDEYENDNFDMAMEVLEMDEIDVSKFIGDIDDAQLLRDLKSKMDPNDFARIFSRGVGELL